LGNLPQYRIELWAFFEKKAFSKPRKTLKQRENQSMHFFHSSFICQEIIEIQEEIVES